MGLLEGREGGDQLLLVDGPAAVEVGYRQSRGDRHGGIVSKCERPARGEPLGLTGRRAVLAGRGNEPGMRYFLVELQ